MDLCRRCTAVVYTKDRCWFCEGALCQGCEQARMLKWIQLLENHDERVRLDGDRLNCG